MSIVVPKDLESSTAIPSCDARVAEKVKSAFSDDTWVWYNPRGHSKRPPFVLISPEVGVAGLAVYGWTRIEIQRVSPGGVQLSDGSHHDPLGELGEELEVLNAKVRDLTPSPPLNGLLVFPNLSDDEFLASGLDKTVPQDVVITSSGLSNGFASRLSTTSPISSEVVDEVRRRLYPDTTFTRPQLVTNEGRAERVEKRIRLDLEQQTSARYLGSETTVVVGVAGSGKSLVAASRARYLMQDHPEWKVKVLCYNQTLVQYLETLVAVDQSLTTKEVLEQLATGKITPEEAGRQINMLQSRPTVDTFHRWAGEHGVRLPFREDRQDEAERRIQEAISGGICRHEYDAVIIDEGQDFRPTWLSFIYQTVRPDRGGLLIVLDTAQCIYQEQSDLGFPGEHVREIRLAKNYRNTEQVGRLAYHVCPEVSPQESDDDRWNALEPEFVLQGDPVQFVWAQSWDEQAEFIAAEIRRLVKLGKVDYRDIAVLYPQRSGTTRLAEALGNAGVPHFMRKRDNRREFSMEDNAVKLLTVHSAKGLEFSVVFLFGIEAIKAGQDSRARVAFVGMTRATDLLYLTYTRMNPLLDRATTAPEWCEFHSWPDDF